MITSYLNFGICESFKIGPLTSVASLSQWNTKKVGPDVKSSGHAPMVFCSANGMPAMSSSFNFKTVRAIVTEN